MERMERGVQQNESLADGCRPVLYHPSGISLWDRPMGGKPAKPHQFKLFSKVANMVIY